MAIPIRHSDSVRNNRKMLKYGRDMREEIERLLRRNLKDKVAFEYLLGRAHRLENRLEALSRHD